MFIPISQIDTGSRIREDYGTENEWKLFKLSLATEGQLQPLRVEPERNGKYMLVMGGRRLRAVSELYAENLTVPGIPEGTIEVALGPELPARVKMMREFAENMQRKDFSPQEKAKYISNFHAQMVSETDGVWTQELTAQTLKLSAGTISLYLRVEKEMATNETVAKAQTLRAAVKRIRVQDSINERLESARTAQDDSLQRATSILSHGNAREWIRTLDDRSADFINFDPPWGDEVSHKSAANHESFDDSEEYADDLMRDLFPQLFRVLKDNRFCVFWHRMWASERMAELAISFGFNLTHTRTPAIWYKPDKLTDQNREPEKRMIEAYEPFYLLRKGDPIFYEKFQNNVFPFNRVSLGSLIHPTEKPIALCDSILRLCSVPGELVIDPTAGSSAMLEAALRANRKAQGCELSQHYYDKGVLRLAEYLKTFTEG
jgi:DNA modification methylase